MSMALTAFICAVAVTVIVGGFYVAFKSSTELLSFIFKFLAPMCALILALFAANLSSSFGGYTIFICINMAMAMAIETFNCFKANEKTTANKIFFGVINAVSLFCLVVGGVLLSQFNVWGLLAGLSLGLGETFVLMSIKKQDWLSWLFKGFTLAFTGMIIGQAVVLLTSHVKLVTAIFYLIASIFITFREIFIMFNKDDLASRLIINISQVVSWILVASSIFFLA